jgi:hypothetical protein
LHARTASARIDADNAMIARDRRAHRRFAALRHVAAPLNVKTRAEAFKLLIFITTWRLPPQSTTQSADAIHSHS